MKKITTLQDIINLIVERTALTQNDLLTMPIEAFETVYEDVTAMIAAIHRVECDVILYSAK